MQHFITESKWDERELIDQVYREVSSVLPKRKLTGLIIDESGWVKKGDKRVGVGWQYCGNVGKISNSQVAVFACLSNGDFASMVDARLYLPQDWCEEAGTPKGTGPSRPNWNWPKRLSVNKSETGFRSILSAAMAITATMPTWPGQSTKWAMFICWISTATKKYSSTSHSCSFPNVNQTEGPSQKGSKHQHRT